MTDQLREKRIGIVGVVIIAIFLTLVCRLWYLQVANGSQLAAAASQSRIRVIQEEAPRGRILDMNGDVIVDNRIARSIVVDRQQLTSTEKKKKVVDRLSRILSISVKDLDKKIADVRISPYKPVPVAIDVSLDKIQYIKEHQEDFPGVDAVPLPVRRYPQGTLAAHLLGYVGEIGEKELEKLQDDKGDYQAGESIGKSGIELAYEKDLRGVPSQRRVEIDVKGQVLREVKYQPPVPGHDVVLSIDINLQKVAEESLQKQIETTRQEQDQTDKLKFSLYKAPGGSAVVIDPQNGFVRAMASFPNYDPAAFVEGIPQSVYNELNDPKNGNAFSNRAIQGLYAPGSTFKMVTALAGVKSNIISTGSVFGDTGCLKVSDRTFCNAGKKANGSISLSRALTVSSDTYFYNIGYKEWQQGKRGDSDGAAIQNLARDLGFQEKSGIELPFEATGRIPDAAWKKKIHDKYPKAFPYAIWLPGDNVNTSIGQGDTLVSPLQMAMAYGAFGNEGKLYKPQLVKEIRKAGSTKAEKTILPVLRRTVALNPNAVSVMKQGFRGVVSDQSGTAHSAFSGFPSSISVGGKTGTAQVSNKQDTSLFVGFSPVENPQYVVVSIVEEGGWGAATAAPIARRIFEGAYNLPLTDIGFAAPPGGVD